MKIPFFAYLTSKITWDFYIVKGNMAMLLGLLGQPQCIKKLQFFTRTFYSQYLSFT